MSVAKHNQEDKIRGDVLTEISEGLVRLVKEYYGTGPSQVKTIYDDDLVLCVLRGSFNQVETTLADAGHADVVVNFRHAFQLVMEPHFRKVVEDATGRKVIAFMSGNETDPDMLGEIFVLEPRERLAT